ncbi:hypothetical protein HAX54_029473, partial [Datura stramonium]|nr:hypothetical protein [Datura stramonium]
ARSQQVEEQRAKGSGALSSMRHFHIQKARSQIPVLLGIEAAKPNSTPRRNNE